MVDVITIIIIIIIIIGLVSYLRQWRRAEERRMEEKAGEDEMTEGILGGREEWCHWVSICKTDV